MKALLETVALLVVLVALLFFARRMRLQYEREMKEADQALQDLYDRLDRQPAPREDLQ